MGRGIYKTIILLKDSLLEIVYPKEQKCICCDREAEVICEECLKKIIRCNDNEISFAFYNSTMKKLILDFKFKKNFAAGELLAKLISEKVKKYDDDYILTFVPITKKKLKLRGFNQCEYICNELSKISNLKVEKTLKQIKEVKEQKTLGKDGRYKNVLGAFEIIDKKQVEGKKIILIDDVITTGATINECKKILMKNGIKKIKLLTIAKSDI